MLEREIERKKRRASRLGVDLLVKRLYFDHGLRHYVSWSRRPEYTLPTIVGATQPSAGVIEFTLGDRRYSFHLTKNKFDDTEHEDLELRQNGQLVFGQTLTVEWYEDSDTHTPLSITAFVEGPWIDELRRLEEQMRELENARQARRERERIHQEASRFGLPEDRSAESWLARVKRVFKG